MPFGLTNAPSTFPAAMNSVFRPLLRKFVIVFFDDILVYSPTLEVHCSHLTEVLSILAANQFYVKLSKCIFCSESVDYLGHIIVNGRLQADPSKLEAMVAWPTPSTVKQLRGFLGLTGYYRRFIAHYAMIAAPLTELLKKDSFTWTSVADDSFTALKAAMISAHVLQLPDFSRTFCVETDASDFGIGAVLLQDGHPLAFSVKSLALGGARLPPITKNCMLLLKPFRNEDNIYWEESSSFAPIKRVLRTCFNKLFKLLINNSMFKN